MNHQVMISFDVDDERIAENIEKAAAKQVSDQILDAAFGREKYYGVSTVEAKMRDYVRDVLTEILEPHKAEIIETAIKTVVANITKSKIVREKLAEQME